MADPHNILGVAEGVRPFLFDFADYEQLDELGVFSDREGQIELIEGVIVQMAPPSGEHTDVTSDMVLGLGLAVRRSPNLGLKVLTQGTLKIGDHSAPEPDVFVARPRLAGKKYYEAADAVLVVEVSISTADADKTVKAPLYARAGIPELWIVEPEQTSVTVYRGPRPDGEWADIQTVTEGAVSPLFSPEIAIVLADLFPAA
ncbi:hypothetical protein KOAAANKH_00033 [Brevundimonas sp. NIBR10]|uniref:Uma2 family endonuclease n=1 Tax=Brevundimonas sp. NIBR10 TaxID=3015997 RepID=UPI0022F154BD|nr:Uma2 family endonuclease [Brevundimonas sp. NIBR10]WGM45173.1 hypothetical protein KOAAANKH_00033 [Brevundimonas sp. NIBR10]